jgi:hypothetical protein
MARLSLMIPMQVLNLTQEYWGALERFEQRSDMVYFRSPGGHGGGAERGFSPPEFPLFSSPSPCYSKLSMSRVLSRQTQPEAKSLAPFASI